MNLILLKEDLEVRFDGLGGITAYHVLTDIGLNVLKPDRVICRLFQRLGLIKGDEDVFNKQPLTTIIEGRKFAAATGHPIRYIDIVFVAYGQVKSIEFGVERGICTDNPSCNVCHATEFCNYYARKTGENLDSKAPIAALQPSSSGTSNTTRFTVASWNECDGKDRIVGSFSCG